MAKAHWNYLQEGVIKEEAHPCSAQMTEAVACANFEADPADSVGCHKVPRRPSQLCSCVSVLGSGARWHPWTHPSVLKVDEAQNLAQQAD